MTKLSQAIALATAMTAGLAATATTHADVEFNAAVTSNYVWRGDTQNNDQTALQGGVDYSHESGLSAGIWTSSLDGDSETDYYAAFGGEASDVSYSIGAIAYDYNNDASDFVEVNASVGLVGATLTYNQKISEGIDDENDDNDSDAYVHLGYGFSLTEDLALDLGAGQVLTDVEDAEGDNVGKYDLSASLTKSLPEFDFSVTATDKEDGENEFFITVAKSF
jgi:uncharacterized protein (TIGR02001 family)